jgi:hypothetical protein
MRPCDVSARPPIPVATAEVTTRWGLRRCRAANAATTSKIASAEPTSWKWVSSLVVPWTVDSASASKVNALTADAFTESGSAASATIETTAG